MNIEIFNIKFVFFADAKKRKKVVIVFKMAYSFLHAQRYVYSISSINFCISYVQIANYISEKIRSLLKFSSGLSFEIYQKFIERLPIAHIIIDRFTENEFLHINHDIVPDFDLLLFSVRFLAMHTSNLAALLLING